MILCLGLFSVSCASSVDPVYAPDTTANDAPQSTGETSHNTEILPNGWCWCIDRDGDGLGDPHEGNNDRYAPLGYIHNCSDTNDQVTDECRLPSDPGCGWWCADLDHDGDGNPRSIVLARNAPADHIEHLTYEACGDCQDTDSSINSHAPEETCLETIDRNCDGNIHYYDQACYEERGEFRH